MPLTYLNADQGIIKKNSLSETIKRCTHTFAIFIKKILISTARGEIIPSIPSLHLED